MTNHELLVNVMTAKVHFNNKHGKLTYSYAHIDQAILDLLRNHESLNVHKICSLATANHGSEVTLARLRPHVGNEKSNAINKWLADRGTPFRLTVSHETINLKPTAR